MHFTLRMYCNIHWFVFSASLWVSAHGFLEGDFLSKTKMEKFGGEINEDVTHRIQAGWLKWRKASGVICFFSSANQGLFVIAMCLPNSKVSFIVQLYFLLYYMVVNVGFKGTRWEKSGSGRNENVKINVWSYKKR